MKLSERAKRIKKLNRQISKGKRVVVGNKKSVEWFSKAWEASKEAEAKRKAEEIKYLVRRLYEIIFN